MRGRDMTQKPLKIAFVIDDSLDRPDGVQQHVLTLGAHFTTLGHDVHYLCSSTERTDLANLHSLAKTVPVRFNGNRLRSPVPTSRRKLVDFMRAQQFDVVHVQSPHSPLFAARVVDAARRVQGPDVRVIGTFHILPFTRGALLASHVLALLLRRNLKRFDQFIAVSPPTVDYARDVFGVPSVAVPNPVATGQFQTQEARDARTVRETNADPARTVEITHVGRLVERKGAPELVKAVAALSPAVRARIRVRIAGTGPLQKELEESIATSGLADIVTLIGHISTERPKFYAGSDICVFPAAAGESFGIVLIEAMAAGAGVVIGGDNPGYRSVLGDNPDVLIQPRDTASFAAALEHLILDTELREVLHQEQAERVTQFDVAKVATTVLELYRG